MDHYRCGLPDRCLHLLSAGSFFGSILSMQISLTPQKPPYNRLDGVRLRMRRFFGQLT
jgi:hypothetical protein